MRINALVAGVAFGVVVGVGAASSASAQLAKLDALINVDNVFEAYISNDPNVLGTQFMSGNNWQTTYSGSYSFDTAATYYLHVRGEDLGAPAMFLATLSLTEIDGTAIFANGTQGLLSNTVDWTATTTFGSGDVTPADLGPNGSGVWGLRAAQDAAARYLWHPSGVSAAPVSYFTTAIRVVPAPGGLAVLGLAAAGLRRRR